MVRAGLALAGKATLLAAVDLAHKTGAGVGYLHERSAAYLFVVVVLSVVWAAAILATRSVTMAIGGGAVLGGAGGNLISLAFWPGVPNPIEVAPIEFNLADVFVLAGFVVVAGATIALLCGDRERLGRPVRYSEPERM
ncbi:MAG: signal peptidase II [Gaiellaceae bacterium]